VFTFSSNVGAAKIALAQGVEAHKAFLKKLGQMDRLAHELPESAPIVPKRWSELNTITIAFGHGIAVAPLQAVMGINAVSTAALIPRPSSSGRKRKPGPWPRRCSEPKPPTRCAI
jgi:cell division protein FtsI (penicillin-binding protein 3)